MLSKPKLYIVFISDYSVLVVNVLFQTNVLESQNVATFHVLCNYVCKPNLCELLMAFGVKGQLKTSFLLKI